MNHLHTLLKNVFQKAVDYDLIPKNPCHFVTAPKREEPKRRSLSQEEGIRLLEAIDKTEMEEYEAMGEKEERREQREERGYARDRNALRGIHRVSNIIAVRIGLATGMRRGEICALRWSDLNDDCTINVSHAFGLKEGGYYLKEPKTHSSARTIPLTKRTFEVLRAMHKDSTRILEGMGVRSADPFILGTQEPDSRPYNPSLLGKEYAAFCKMNGFNCTFHDLRHTFATMMIAAGTDVRTVASYLGHSSVSMTLNIYADVDPDAKLNAVEKIMDSFDMDMDSFFGDDPLSAPAPQPQVPGITFTIEQLEALLAQAKRSQGITV